jgi:hypothetical protein
MKEDLHPWHDEYCLPSVRAEIDELFASERELASILEDVACLSVRLVFQRRWRPRSTSSWAGPATSAETMTGRAAATASSRPPR